MNGDSRPFDLHERTALFGEEVVRFCRLLPITPVTKSLIDQLVRSGTSIGANYCEADDAGSRKEFIHRVSLCKRESRESKHWFRMISAALPDQIETARTLWLEAKELHLIFCAIHVRARKNSRDH